MEKEVLQPTEKARELIANGSAEFLKARMHITQEIISNKNVQTITLDEYIKGLQKCREREINEYSKQNMCRVLVNNDEIDELVSLVKESLTKYSIGDCAFMGIFSYLVKVALSNLEKNINGDSTLSLEERSSKLSVIKKWKEISYGDYTFGIDPRIQGEASWRYFDEFRISDSKKHIVCKVGLDGTDKMIAENRRIYPEDILLSNKLFMGEINCYDEKTPSIFIYNEGENNAKDILGGWIYPISKQEDDNIYVVLGLSLNSFLDNNGLSYLKEDLYDENMIDKIFNVYNNNRSINLTNEEKERIEKIVSVATEWWANAISNPRFDNGDLKASLIAGFLSLNKDKPNDEKIEKFKEYLANEIRGGMFVNSEYFTLRVDYHPDEYLYKAATKAKLDTDICAFPWKTSMTIENGKISVRAGYGANVEVIYDANQDSLGPKKKRIQ